LISLDPNATGLLHPLEVATSWPLKLGWKTAGLDWHRHNSNKILNREWFSPFLDGAVQKYSLACSAVCDFRACGLYSWNPENTDLLECLGGEKKLSISGPSRNPSRTSTCDMFVETVGS